MGWTCGNTAFAPLGVSCDRSKAGDWSHFYALFLHVWRLIGHKQLGTGIAGIPKIPTLYMVSGAWWLQHSWHFLYIGSGLSRHMSQKEEWTSQEPYFL